MDQSDTYCLNITDDDDNQGVQLQQNDGDGSGSTHGDFEINDIALIYRIIGPH